MGHNWTDQIKFIPFSVGGVNGVLLTHYEAPKHVRRLRRGGGGGVRYRSATCDSPLDEDDAPGRARLFRFTVARLLSSVSQPNDNNNQPDPK